MSDEEFFKEMGEEPVVAEEPIPEYTIENGKAELKWVLPIKDKTGKEYGIRNNIETYSKTQVKDIIDNLKKNKEKHEKSIKVLRKDKEEHASSKFDEVYKDKIKDFIRLQKDAQIFMESAKVNRNYKQVVKMQSEFQKQIEFYKKILSDKRW